MKLLYVVGAYGPRYLANEIHRELLMHYARHGHRCIVFAGVTPGELHGEPVSYQDGPISVVRQLCRNTGYNRAAYEVGSRLLQYPRWLPLLCGYRRLLLRHPDIDVVHADAAYPFGALAAVGTPRHIALVPSIHGGDVIAYPGYGYGRFRVARSLLRYTWRRSALVRVNSQPMAERAIALHCPPAKLRPVLVNIGSRFFEDSTTLSVRRQAARCEIAQAHGFDPVDPLVLAVGRLLPLKGFADAIAAWSNLHATHSSARLLIAGPDFVDPIHGDQRRFLAKQIERLGLAEHVLLLPSLDYEREMLRYLRAADVLLAVAHIEGLNRVVAEAGSQGTPAVVSTTTPIATLIAQLDAGLIVPPHDPPAIAAAVRQLLDDPVLWQSCAAASRRLAQRFRSEVIAEQLLAIYAEARSITTLSA